MPRLLALILLCVLAPAWAGPITCLPEGVVPAALGGTGVAVARGGNAAGDWVGGYCPRADGLGWRAVVLVWPHTSAIEAAVVAAVRTSSDPLAAINAALRFDCATTLDASQRALCDAAFADVKTRRPPPMHVTASTSWGATCAYAIKADGQLDTTRCAAIVPIGTACRCDLWHGAASNAGLWCWSAPGKASDCRRAR